LQTGGSDTAFFFLHGTYASSITISKTGGITTTTIKEISPSKEGSHVPTLAKLLSDAAVLAVGGLTIILVLVESLHIVVKHPVVVDGTTSMDMPR
jgi:hypothetical protein